MKRTPLYLLVPTWSNAWNLSLSLTVITAITYSSFRTLSALFRSKDYKSIAFFLESFHLETCSISRIWIHSTHRCAQCPETKHFPYETTEIESVREKINCLFRDENLRFFLTVEIWVFIPSPCPGCPTRSQRLGKMLSKTGIWKNPPRWSMVVWSTLSSRILHRLKPPASIDGPFSFPPSYAFAKLCRMINGKSKQESPWRSSILSISRSSQVLVVSARWDSQSSTFRSSACLRNSVWGEELRSCCTIRRRETSMVVSFDLHSQQKVTPLIYSSVWVRLPLLLISILQRDLYNLLVHEDAQQVLLTPDPSLYKYTEDLSWSFSSH